MALQLSAPESFLAVQIVVIRVQSRYSPWRRIRTRTYGGVGGGGAV